MLSVQEKMKGKNKLVPRLLGVTKDSVLRLDEKTKEILKTWPLTTVRRWGASPNTFTLDFGDYSDQYYSVQTTEAEQILQLIAGYIDIILKKVWDGPLGCGNKYLRGHYNLVRKVVGLWQGEGIFHFGTIPYHLWGPPKLYVVYNAWSWSQPPTSV
jgi:PTB domain (IRS-1 type).